MQIMHNGTPIEDNAPPPRWNLFAAVLQEVLGAHDARLGQLDDRARIHPEKVRRLQRSLRTPKSFHVLNPDEIDQVVQAFTLTSLEKIRLRAAVLATAVEATLMGRIAPTAARAAAELILPIIEEALLDYFGEDDDTIRALDDEFFDDLDDVALEDVASFESAGGVAHTVDRAQNPSSAGETDVDTALERAVGPLLDALEHAHLTLMVAEMSASFDHREDLARAAQHQFTYVLPHLPQKNERETEQEKAVISSLTFWRTFAEQGVQRASAMITRPLE